MYFHGEIHLIIRFPNKKRAIPEFVRKKKRAKFACLEMGPTIPDEYVALQYYSKSKQNKTKTIFKKYHYLYYNCIQLKSTFANKCIRYFFFHFNFFHEINLISIFQS